MSRRMLGAVSLVFLLAVPTFAADRDVDNKSLRGIPKGHRHTWAVVGGTALGAGLGAIGGTKGVFKGALIGGGGASMFYLAKHRGQEGPWSYVITNAALVAGIGWTVCDCGAGFGAGALIGGGGTALVQAFQTKHRRLAAATGAETTRPDNPPPPQYQPPQTPPPQSEPQTPPPPGEPQAQPPQTQPPQAQPPQAQPPQSQTSPPPQDLPDAPLPRNQ